MRPACTLLAGLLSALLVAGCDTLPRSGPTTSNVEDEADNPTNFPFRLIKFDVQASSVLLRNPDGSMSTSGFFQNRKNRGGPTLGAGDVIQVTVMEPASGGVFTGVSSSTVGSQSAALVTLPEMTVDSQGAINFPLVGTVQVAGKSTRQAAVLLEDELKSRVIQPQVIVRLVGNRTSRAIISGSVKTPGEYEITAAGETLLQLVTRAGGAAVSPSDLVVELTRGGVTRSVRLQALIDRPTADVHLAPGDFVNVAYRPRVYFIAGAVTRPAESPLPPEKLTLAAALARSGGMVDTRSDIKGVFVLRYETRAVVDQLQPDHPADMSYVPVVYQFDMGSASGYFLSDSFVVRERDIIYLSNAPSVELQKFLDLFRILVTPAIQGAAVANGFAN